MQTKNKEKSICQNCGREFFRRIKPNKKPMPVNVRAHNAKTCCEKCARNRKVKKDG